MRHTSYIDLARRLNFQPDQESALCSPSFVSLQKLMNLLTADQRLQQSVLPFVEKPCRVTYWALAHVDKNTSTT